MKNPRLVKTQLIIECTVLVDDELLVGITDQYTTPINDLDAASQLLFAMINPKLQGCQIEGNWDGVCSFEGRFKDIIVKYE